MIDDTVRRMVRFWQGLAIKVQLLLGRMQINRTVFLVNINQLDILSGPASRSTPTVCSA